MYGHIASFINSAIYSFKVEAILVRRPGPSPPRRRAAAAAPQPPQRDQVQYNDGRLHDVGITAAAAANPESRLTIYEHEVTH